MRFSISNLLKLTSYISINKTNVRFYPRWRHRQPIKVLNPEDYEMKENEYSRKIIQPQNLDNIIELNSIDTKTKHVHISNKPLTSHIKQERLIDFEALDAKTHFLEKPILQENHKKMKQEIKHTKDELLSTTFDEDGNYIYTKMKNNDPKIGTLMLMVKSRKLRDRKKYILLEGKRLIRDALQAKCTVEHILFSRKSDLDYIKDLLPKKNICLYKMAYRDMQMWSDLTTSPGIMGIFKTPELKEINNTSNSSIPLIIICDNIREPGNLGAILRASVAVEAKTIILTNGCVDLWETKVLRSSCGAHFKAPILKNLNWQQIREQIPDNSHIFLADNNILSSSNSDLKNNISDLCLNIPILPYYSIDFTNCLAIVLIIGGETLGLSEESYRLAVDNKGFRLNIPLNKNIESLNAGTALGIIAFEIKRQLLLKI